MKRLTKRPRTGSLVAVTLSLFLFVAGCGTIRAHSAGYHAPFGGAEWDGYCIARSKNGTTVALIFDYPFSVLADIVLLPYTFPRFLLVEVNKDRPIPWGY